MRSKILCFSLLCTGALMPIAQAQTVIFNGFGSTAGLTLNGSATTTAGEVPSDGTVLRLVPANFFQSGSVFSTTLIPLTGNSFSTEFSFRITHPEGGIGDGDGPGADGLTFTMQTVSNSVGSSGGGLGYSGIPKSFAIEYDTFDNGEINGNHVAVDTDGNLNDLLAVPVTTRMNDGNLWYSWIDYDGTTHDLEVRLSQDSTRPATPIISTTSIDIESLLGQSSAFVGFTSATGSGIGNHDIVAWQFNNSLAPITSIGVPDAASTSLLLMLGLVPLVAMRRRRC